jgi:acetyltransferase-like isoleucine patch superfamily enzyme
VSFYKGRVPLLQRVRFLAGSTRAALTMGGYAGDADIDWTVQVIESRKVFLGRRVEILRGTTLDGRSRGERGLTIGAGCRIKENVWLACYGGGITLGDEVFVSRNVVMEGHGGIDVGSCSSIGPNVVITSHSQVTTGPGRYRDRGYVLRPVVIGHDVHIGAGAVVVAGVHIGDGTYVGANSVVTRDLVGGRVYVGAPARDVGPFDRPSAVGPVGFHEEWRSDAAREQPADRPWRWIQGAPDWVRRRTHGRW